jgi:hypothetical protein
MVFSPRLLVVGLLVVLAVLLFASVRQESQVFDESAHLLAGFEYWKHGDFGRNPEHPPLAKLLATIPLLRMGLKEPAPVPVPFFKAQDFINGAQLLYSGGANADAILIRGRMMIALFSVMLGLLVFLAGREMFGELAGLIGLVLYVFEPVLLANGALVTTDMPLACMFFAAVYCFYRYSRRPTYGRLALCALVTGLALAAKHSGALLLPVLFLLAVVDVWMAPAKERRFYAVRLAGALVVIGLVSYACLWAIYGFRFAARPGELQMMPALADYAAGIPSHFKQGVILFFARYHLLPQAYLYGWADILRIPGERPVFVLGRHFSHGQWFFFPAVFLIKSTLAVLLLVVVAPFAATRERMREFLFLSIPAVFFFAVAIGSKLNLGSRHLMPVYPFFLVIAGATAAWLARRSRALSFAVAALLVFDVVSSLRAFPDFLAYSNEIAGGPSRTYRLVSDSDVDWGQGLKWVKTYLDEHPTTDCWMVYTQPLVDPGYYGIHCKRLLSSIGHLLGMGVAPIPPTISGTVLLSSSQVEGHFWGPDTLNPYDGFRVREPDDMIGNVILVYRGTFAVPLLAAANKDTQAVSLLRQNRGPEALALAQQAVVEAPESAEANQMLSVALRAVGRSAEADQAHARARELARANHPEYQQYLLK